MIQRLLTTEFQLVTSAALAIGFFSFLSKLLGVIRNRIFAGEFGAGDTMDVYFAAFLIPDLLYNLFIAGMLSAVFIPAFAALWERSQEEAWQFTRVVFTALAAALAIFSIIAIWFAPQLAALVAPGFSAEKQADTASLMRIMFASPILLGASSVVGSVLQARRMFFSFALAPIMYNLGIITGAVFFVRSFGVAGLALGVVLGALLHFAVQLPAAWRVGFSFRPLFDLKHPGLARMFWLSLPRVVGLAANQLNFVIITAIASTIASGSIAIFNFANDLQFVPIGIVALSFVSAVFPFLSSLRAEGNMAGFLDRFYSAANEILFLVIPVSIFLILERAQIVRVLLGYGQFSWDDTRLTAAVLGVFALSIFAQSLVPLFSRAFYALEDTKTPVAVNIGALALNVALSFFFLHLMREGGVFAEAVASFLKVEDVPGMELLALPLAFSVSAVVNLLAMYFMFSHRIPQFDGSRIVASLTRINIAAFLMALAVYGTLYAVAPMVNMQTFAGVFVQGMAAFLVGLAAYCAVSYTLKTPELFSLFEATPSGVKKLVSRLPFA